MTLSFMQKWESGEPTFFIEKIWLSIIEKCLLSNIENVAEQHFRHGQVLSLIHI